MKKRPFRKFAFQAAAKVLWKSGVIRRQLRNKPQKRLQVLAYHSLKPHFFFRKLFEIERAEEHFEKQMYFLKHFMSPVSLDEVLGFLYKGKALPPNPVLVTIDDGYRDCWDSAFPSLKKFSIPAVLFLTTQPVDQDSFLWFDKLYYWLSETAESSLSVETGSGVRRFSLETITDRRNAAVTLRRILKSLPNRERLKWLESIEQSLNLSPDDPRLESMKLLDWPQVKKMSEAGIEFGSHSVSHPIMTRLNDDEFAFEAKFSKNRIEESISKPVRAFAFPSGRKGEFNRSAQDKLKKIGYQCAFTFMPGYVSEKTPPFEINRFGFFGENLESFAYLMSGLNKKKKNKL